MVEVGVGTYWNTADWHEGHQYVVFRNVSVTAGQPVLITVSPGADGYAPFNGMQIVPGGATCSAWVDDALPAGAAAEFYLDHWNWVTGNPAPYSGSLAHQSDPRGGLHQHFFYGASSGMAVGPGDTLFCYVYLDPDPAKRPRELMFQWSCPDASSWNHRAFWGEDLIALSPRTSMGSLPASGSWVRLEIPAEAVDLVNRTVTGMAFTLYDGMATWDYAGNCAAIFPQSSRPSPKANPCIRA